MSKRTLCPATVFNALCFVQEQAEAKAEQRKPLPHWSEDWPALRLLMTWGYVRRDAAADEWHMTLKGRKRFQRMDNRQIGGAA